ncbi:MAG TPA: hypothetical protein VGE52_07250, partial [Pirellulales bacterium]
GWRYSYPGMYEGLAWDLNIGIEGGVVTWFLNLGPLAVTFCGWNFVVFKLPIGPPPITCFDLGSGLSLPWVSTNPNGRLCMGCGYEDLVYAPGNALVTLT